MQDATAPRGTEQTDESLAQNPGPVAIIAVFRPGHSAAKVELADVEWVAAELEREARSLRAWAACEQKLAGATTL